MTVPEAPFEQTDGGFFPKGDGWFVLNPKDARWYDGEGRPALCHFEGDAEFKQLTVRKGTRLFAEGEPMIPLTLTSSQAFEKGVVKLVYARA